ncbi:peptide chain release factor 2 [Candidatus Peregrinibacteria bacterium]|nr:peptide chain release factor 2 [Candidatus Peregrinibacteria bacterium]
MHEHKQTLDTVVEEVAAALKKIDLSSLKDQIQKLTAETQDPDFWNDQERAQLVSKQLSDVQKEVEEWEKMKNDCDELVGLFPSIDIEADPETAAEFKTMVEDLEKGWRKLEVKTFLSGRYDKYDAIVSIHAGTGGKDAMDFADMLLRMYLRYAENQEFSVEVVEKSPGEEVGLKSVTVFVRGMHAYGYLKGERGVHRLVRLSPFNSKNSRETSFAFVDVLPDLPETEVEEIDKGDLRIDTFRSSGAGGQSVNKTSSAVRITHIPTNIVVTCQDERSQLQNKERAMKILVAKLHDLKEQQQVDEIAKIRGEKQEIAWGNQIRSYVLQPYTMVKDHRTGYEENNPDKVFDGELDGFIEAELKKL